MTRILVTYHGPSERRLAAHRAVLLTRRGLDVDVASEDAAKEVPDGGYDRVVMAPDLQVGHFPPRGGVGALRIIGAERRPPEPEPIVGTAFVAKRPAPAKRPASAWPPLAGILSAIVLVVAARAAGAPPYALLVVGLVAVAAATHLFRTLAAPPATGGALRPTAVASTPSSGHSQMA
jgi:hypothetical protein